MQHHRFILILYVTIFCLLGVSGYRRRPPKGKFSMANIVSGLRKGIRDFIPSFRESYRVRQRLPRKAIPYLAQEKPSTSFRAPKEYVAIDEPIFSPYIQRDNSPIRIQRHPSPKIPAKNPSYAPITSEHFATLNEINSGESHSSKPRNPFLRNPRKEKFIYRSWNPLDTEIYPPSIFAPVARFSP
nr:uncharacterized protein LOC121122142 [Lepeophtheirus salmonis]